MTIIKTTIIDKLIKYGYDPNNMVQSEITEALENIEIIVTELN